MNIPLTVRLPVVYPESDGEPMADNSRQLRWIFVFFGNLAALFRARADVLVGGNMLWYPVEGVPEVGAAPDAFVVFGRPKGDRGSYQQWVEGNIPMTVVFEVLSPGNTVAEMDEKEEFYEVHGVEEYYVYDPDRNHLKAFVRHGEVWVRVRRPHNSVSPRLGIRFDLPGPELVVYGPDDDRFLTFEELKAAQLEAREQAEQAREQAEQAREQAEQARTQAGEAEQRAEQAEQRARRAERLAELGFKVRRGLATLEEVQELDRLEEQPPCGH